MDTPEEPGDDTGDDDGGGLHRPGRWPGRLQAAALGLTALNTFLQVIDTTRRLLHG